MALYGWREGSEGDRVEAGAGIGRGVSRKLRMKRKKNKKTMGNYYLSMRLKLFPILKLYT